MSVGDYEKLWQSVKRRLDENDDSFPTYSYDIGYEGAEDHCITLSASSLFMKNHVEAHFKHKIEAELAEISGEKIAVTFIAKERSEGEAEERVPAEPVAQRVAPTEPAASPNKKPHPTLQPRFTFDNFVPSSNTDYAYNVALAVAQNPGTAYNPLLIYGGVGLGKTHLMNAIGNFIYGHENKDIVSVTSEEFLNEYVHAVANRNSMREYKNKYRKTDVLLIDDIQFFQQKDGTQEELFHIYEALSKAYKQMVFTCDRPVYEMKNIEERLLSRFRNCTSVNLQAPVYETRVAILQKKLEGCPIEVPDEVIAFIARNIETNVRDLEAALRQIVSYADITKQAITIDIAKGQIKHLVGPIQNTNLQIESIQKVVADHWKVSINDLKSDKRAKRFAFPRQIAMYMARSMTDYTLTDIGNEFGYRDHSTVNHSCEKIEDLLKTEPSYQDIIESLQRKLRDGYIK